MVRNGCVCAYCFGREGGEEERGMAIPNWGLPLDPMTKPLSYPPTTYFHPKVVPPLNRML